MTFKWQIWSDLVTPPCVEFIGTEEEAVEFFEKWHHTYVKAGYLVENYGDEIHLYDPDTDFDDEDADIDPVAGMTIGDSITD